MTPGARVAAAIDVLDDIVGGTPAELALTRWGRHNRYAGSKDRRAVRDYVYDALRHWRSDACRGGGTSGRARMIGRLRAAKMDLAHFFSGEGYAPAVLSENEIGAGGDPVELSDALDLPNWVWVQMVQDLGEVAAAAAGQALQRRAPTTLRVNVQKLDQQSAIRRLQADGIVAECNPRAPTALTVSEGARRIRSSQTFSDGAVELQDASSQAVICALPDGQDALDYCAGGGGKALAMAAQGRRVTAHDANPTRMRDLPQRATRAGVHIHVVPPDQVPGTFDIVLCDVPCSGSGTWRRDPEAKWALTKSALADLLETQFNVLQKARAFVRPGGNLVYATCSVFEAENTLQIEKFLEANPDWGSKLSQSYLIDDDGDGFFTSHLVAPA